MITIAVNYSHLYEEMRKRGIDNDDFNIEAQAKITVGHEIGHGIVYYLVNYYDGENEATGRWSSYLGRIIDKI